MIDSVKNYRVIDALFFLFLGSILPIGESISSCRLNKKINNNPYFRHFIFFVIIYFTNSFIQDNTIKRTFINSLILYILYIVLMRNNYYIIILVIMMFSIHKLITQYLSELKTNNDSKETIEKWKKFNDYMIKLGISTMILGFLYNIYDKHKKFGASFRILEYIFQTMGCKK